MSTAPDLTTATVPLAVLAVPAIILLGQADAGGCCGGGGCDI